MSEKVDQLKTLYVPKLNGKDSDRLRVLVDMAKGSVKEFRYLFEGVFDIELNLLTKDEIEESGQSIGEFFEVGKTNE